MFANIQQYEKIKFLNDKYADRQVLGWYYVFRGWGHLL